MTASAESLPLSLAEILALGESEADKVRRSLAVLDAVVDAVSASLTPEADSWRLSECDFARDLRRFERLRETRQRLSGTLSTRSPDEGTISVPELARGIGQTDGVTRGLLERGMMPGARRKTPGKKNSPWIIPASAADEYLAQHNGRKEK